MFPKCVWELFFVHIFHPALTQFTENLYAAYLNSKLRYHSNPNPYSLTKSHMRNQHKSEHAYHFKTLPKFRSYYRKKTAYGEQFRSQGFLSLSAMRLAPALMRKGSSENEIVWRWKWKPGYLNSSLIQIKTSYTYIL